MYCSYVCSQGLTASLGQVHVNGKVSLTDEEEGVGHSPGCKILFIFAGSFNSSIGGMFANRSFQYSIVIIACTLGIA